VANKRIFYACQRAGIAPLGSNNFVTLRGIQTLGMTTNFNLEQVFEVGALPIYENIEGMPEVEVNTEKVLDGYCPVYLLATQSDEDGDEPPNAGLAGRSQGVCSMVVDIYDETGTYAEGTPGAEVKMSGLYVSSVGYTANVDGNATESVSLVGQNKIWVIGGDTGNYHGDYDLTAASWDTVWNDGDGDVNPKAITGSGGVNRREDVLFGSGASVSLLPLNMPGVVNAGGGSGLNIMTNDQYGVHVQSWGVNVDFNRTELFELGRRGTYYRYINFPVEVTNEISVISVSGDMVSATEAGIYDDGTGGPCGTRYNLTDQWLRLVLCEGLVVDSGKKNKLSSVAHSGGDAGGDNVEVSYSYTNFNDFDVKHPSDPVVALRP
jgi:hypothetical protein